MQVDEREAGLSAGFHLIAMDADQRNNGGLARRQIALEHRHVSVLIHSPAIEGDIDDCDRDDEERDSGQRLQKSGS